MTCEIDINTDRVWQTGSYMLVGRRANFDALWNSINRLDSVLESLRAYDNASGTVTRNVDKAQQNLRKCRTQCIDVTTNAMVRTGNFLQDVAIEYEASERYVKSLWDDNYTHRSWSFTKDDLASLISQAGKLIAKDPLAFVATFAAECAEAFAKGWEKVSPYLDYVIDAVTAAGIIFFALSNPAGWVVLGVFAIATLYKYKTHGGSIIGDSLEAGAVLLGCDKQTASNLKSLGKCVQGVGELFLPGGGLAKAAGYGLKGLGVASRAANLLSTETKFAKAFRNSVETVASAGASKASRYAIARSLVRVIEGKEPTKFAFRVVDFNGAAGRTIDKGTGLIGAINVKMEPMEYLTKKFGLTENASKVSNSLFDGASWVNDSGHAIEDIEEFHSKMQEQIK